MTITKKKGKYYPPRTLANATKEEQEEIRGKHKVLDEFWAYRSKPGTASVRNGGPCDWCDKFKPMNFRVCMNCGNLLGGEGAL